MTDEEGLARADRAEATEADIGRKLHNAAGRIEPGGHLGHGQAGSPATAAPA